jgi:hypothetical protein
MGGKPPDRCLPTTKTNLWFPTQERNTLTLSFYLVIMLYYINSCTAYNLNSPSPD